MRGNAKLVHNLSPVTNPSADSIPRYQPADGWRTRRIWIAGAFGAMLAGSRRILDFWSLGAAGSEAGEGNVRLFCGPSAYASEIKWRLSSQPSGSVLSNC
jgi:hypothetical protein